MPVTTSAASAPGALEFVRQFVNTLDIEAGSDQLHDSATYGAWAVAHDLDVQVSAPDLARARELREALREALLANHERAPLPSRTVDALNAASEDARLAVRFEPEGTRLVPGAAGIGLLFGRIVATVTSAMADSTWPRLKACAADNCRWGFYDTSRSRTGQWCSMSICGNRAKQARYRTTARASQSDH